MPHRARSLSRHDISQPTHLLFTPNHAKRAPRFEHIPLGEAIHFSEHVLQEFALLLVGGHQVSPLPKTLCSGNQTAPPRVRLTDANASNAHTWALAQHCDVQIERGTCAPFREFCSATHTADHAQRPAFVGDAGQWTRHCSSETTGVYHHTPQGIIITSAHTNGCIEKDRSPPVQVTWPHVHLLDPVHQASPTPQGRTSAFITVASEKNGVNSKNASTPSSSAL